MRRVILLSLLAVFMAGCVTSQYPAFNTKLTDRDKEIVRERRKKAREIHRKINSTSPTYR